ncbi:DUF308 domain-containing protein [Candidatus Saccharibacteria bacterium]|nr:DUF308 domain-containing protein [Candidatus Saccharibacteria bacterium]
MNKDSTLDKIVSSIALFCIGLCFVVWADQVTEWIAILFGIIALIYAIVKLITFLRLAPERRTTLLLLYVILSFAAGVLLVSRASFIKEAISFVIGIYIILTSSIQLLNVSDFRRRTKSHAGSYLWPAIGIVVGILCVTGQFIVPNELARLTGLVMMVYAAVYLTGFLTFSRNKNTISKAIKDTPKIREGEIVKEKKK